MPSPDGVTILRLRVPFSRPRLAGLAKVVHFSRHVLIGRLAYVVEDSLAVMHPIELGSLSIAEAEVVAGLEEGDRIIISDTSRFEGAERVLLRR